MGEDNVGSVKLNDLPKISTLYDKIKILEGMRKRLANNASAPHLFDGMSIKEMPLTSEAAIRLKKMLIIEIDRSVKNHTKQLELYGVDVS